MLPYTKFFAAVFYREQEVYLRTIDLLKEKFSEIDYIGDEYPFNHSSYYEKEMGDNLKKRILSFYPLQNPQNLADSKLDTCQIEEALKTKSKRQVNIDVGYLDFFKVVLASIKGRGNKIYLSNGVWLDMILYFEKGQFKHFPWSFLDYKTGIYDQDLLKIRQLYKKNLKKITAK